MCLEESAPLVLWLRVVHRMLVNVAVSWSVSRKYMTSIGSHFLRLVRQFVIAVSDSRDTLTEALLAKARKLAAKNQPVT